MKKDLKIGGKVVLLMLIGAVVGGLGSMVINRSNLFEAVQNLGNMWIRHGYTIFLAWTIFYLVAMISLYFLGKRQLSLSLEREDELPEDGYLAFGLILSGLGFVLLIGLFMIMVYGIDYHTLRNFQIAVVFFILAAFIGAMMQHFYVKLVKSYNSQKDGEVTDIHFQKKWVDSSDEREQLDIFEAGYHAYSFIQTLGVILLLLNGIYTVTTHSGISSLVTLMVLLSGGKASYYLSANKKAKKRKEKKIDSSNIF